MKGASYSYGGATIQALNSKGLVGLEMVRKELGTKKNIVIISGAGISTNAGSKSYSICSEIAVF